VGKAIGEILPPAIGVAVRPLPIVCLDATAGLSG
jgi:hypothetical protein